MIPNDTPWTGEDDALLREFVSGPDFLIVKKNIDRRMRDLAEQAMDTRQAECVDRFYELANLLLGWTNLITPPPSPDGDPDQSSS